MPYKPSHVANSFLVRGRDERIAIDPLKIQKLVYFFHGWFLATRDSEGIGEHFEAWTYGPVVPSLYREFKSNGSRPIEGFATDVDAATGEYKSFMVDPADERFTQVFNRVWDRYKAMTGLQLSSVTHAPGTPWYLARRRGATYLSNEEIKAYFRKLALSTSAAPSP